MATRTAVKIMGERSTGTNLLARVLDTGFDLEIVPNSRGLDAQQRKCLPRLFTGGWSSRRAAKEAIQDHNHYVDLPENGGWKHAAVTTRFLEEFAIPSRCTVLCMVRHPVEWTRSMHRNPFHGLGKVPRDYSKFIRTPWIGVGRDELGRRLFPSLLTLYAEKVATYEWLTRRYDNAFIVRYEDLLFEPEGTFKRCGLWDLCSTDIVEIPQDSARSFGKKQLDRSRYLQKAHDSSYDLLDREDREFICSTLDGSRLLKLYPE